MKKEIVFPKCRTELRELFPTDTPHPREHVKFVDGTARYDFICDSCSIPIPKTRECTAFTIWADHGADPYAPWEPGYLFVLDL